MEVACPEQLNSVPRNELVNVTKDHDGNRLPLFFRRHVMLPQQVRHRSSNTNLLRKGTFSGFQRSSLVQLEDDFGAVSIERSACDGSRQQQRGFDDAGEGVGRFDQEEFGDDRVELV